MFLKYLTQEGKVYVKQNAGTRKAIKIAFHNDSTYIGEVCNFQAPENYRQIKDDEFGNAMVKALQKIQQSRQRL